MEQQPKLTGMVIVDLKREIVEKDKEIETLKKEVETLREKNKELAGMLEIATSQLREKKAQP